MGHGSRVNQRLLFLVFFSFERYSLGSGLLYLFSIVCSQALLLYFRTYMAMFRWKIQGLEGRVQWMNLVVLFKRVAQEAGGGSDK
jgi:hypothetical protein